LHVVRLSVCAFYSFLNTLTHNHIHIQAYRQFAASSRFDCRSFHFVSFIRLLWVNEKHVKNIHIYTVNFCISVCVHMYVHLCIQKTAVKIWHTHMYRRTYTHMNLPKKPGVQSTCVASQVVTEIAGRQQNQLWPATLYLFSSLPPLPHPLPLIHSSTYKYVAVETAASPVQYFLCNAKTTFISLAETVNIKQNTKNICIFFCRIFHLDFRFEFVVG